jgi:MSHA biogenesis protein MshK
MAEPVNAIRRLHLAALALLLAPLAQAQPVQDPMRPAHVAPGSVANGATPSAGSGGPVLQSVLISPARKTAVINGEAVNLGGRFGEATLVKVSETEVVLKSGSTLTTLKLYPNVEKSSVARAKTAVKGSMGGQ